MKKYKVQLEKLKNIRFSGKTIGCFGNFYKILGIAINYILCEKTRKIQKRSNENVKKTAISGIFPVFSAGKKFFLKIRLGHVLAIAITHF